MRFGVKIDGNVDLESSSLLSCVAFSSFIGVLGLIGVAGAVLFAFEDGVVGDVGLVGARGDVTLLGLVRSMEFPLIGVAKKIL